MYLSKMVLTQFLQNCTTKIQNGLLSTEKNLHYLLEYIFYLKSTTTHSIENGSVVHHLEGNSNFFGS
jgi:hypothetical protein